MDLYCGTMMFMISRKVQLEQDVLDFIDEAVRSLNYKSRSEYMRTAILEKIDSDKRRLRAMRREAAMEAYASASPEHVFESIEAEDFEGR